MRAVGKSKQSAAGDCGKEEDEEEDEEEEEEEEEDDNAGRGVAADGDSATSAGAS